MRLSGFQNPPLRTNRLILGDALQVMGGISDSSIDLILTDPSYGIDYQSNRRTLRNKLPKLMSDTYDHSRWLLRQFLPEAYRVLKPGSHLYIFNRWDVYPFFFNEVQKAGFTIKNCLVWAKNNHGSGDLYGAYAYQHEFCIFSRKDGTPRLLRGKRTSDMLNYQKVSSSNLLHATQKPLRMLLAVVEKSTEPGEVVLDPFCGSGSACKAAYLLGRRYIGIDCDPEVIAVARENMEVLE
jgi:site-specific DNA-methyltransferase (adenine-specific)